MEHGPCVRPVGRWPVVSGAHRGRSVESL
jgi:hypothetical protein